MDHETAAQVAQTRARMAEIRERLFRLDPANAVTLVDLEKDLSALVTDARWLLERIDRQREAFLSYARDLVQTHEGMRVASSVVARQLQAVIDGIEAGATLDQAAQP